MAIAQFETPYRHGHDFGLGIDGFTGSPMGKVVKGDILHVDGATAGLAQFQITRVSSTADLEQKLGIDAEASYGAGLFSASARFNFVKDNKVQTESLFMAVTATVTLGFRQILDPNLSDDAALLVDKPEQFAKRYGDRFVRGISSGGLFVGILNMQTSGRHESDAIALDLKGAYGLFSAAGKAKFEKVQNEHSSQLSILVYKEGGPVGDSLDDPSNPLSLYALLQRWLKSFQDDPASAGTPYSVTIAPTTIATGPLPPNVADLEHAQDVLVLCARARSEALDRFNLLDYILNNPANYDFSGSPQSGIVAAFKGCQFDLDLIADTASAAIDQPADAKTPADFADAKNVDYPRGLLPETMPVLKPRAPAAAGPKGIWLVKSAMLAARGATSLLDMGNGKLIAMTQSVNTADTSIRDGKVEAYDTAINTWSATGAVCPLAGTATRGPNGQIFVLGYDYHAKRYGALMAYHPDTNTWRACAPLRQIRSGAVLAAGGNGKLYAIGGRIGEPASLIQEIEEYDPVSDSWTHRAPMPTIRDSIGLATATNGKIYVAGGLGQKGGHWAPNNWGALPNLDEYDPVTDQWTRKAPMRTPRGAVTVGAGLNGRIYAIGGLTVQVPPAGPFVYTALAVVEEYDPATDTWTNVAPLNMPRCVAGAATMPDGAIYVAGGRSMLGGQTVDLSDVENFLP